MAASAPATKRRSLFVVLGALASLWAFSCTEQIEVGRDLADNAGTGGAPLNTGGANGGKAGAPAHACQPAACKGKVYQCGDCLDNDGDHLADSDDPECTGPCDNSEDSYYGGIPGQNNAPCRQDCYFDQDTGSGDDHCYWSHECDPRSLTPDFPPSGDSQCAYDPNSKIPGTEASCQQLSEGQESTCLATCLPLTPNGCDCFGCCELPAQSGNYVWLGSATQNVGTCNADNVSDPSACHPCTPVRSCLNPCEACEVCVGRSAPPADCTSNNPPRCPAGVAACGQVGEPDCDPGYYCITGCCMAAPR
ncbi:MAG TPA: hypothetical protein VFK05_29925 [Polyangiaceae bacterium]|nr:hypothetical protein [Polyangiaceae bacterium]